ncbi:MAG: serine O-acetyltransferase [Alphaproteobacteria bacterium]
MASIRAEIDSILARDPAARTRLEVVLCYAGFHAIRLHRLSHWLWQKDAKLPARLLATLGRLVTGIEIHPAAVIGEDCFIDHGFGVVIGETAVIGNHVTLYHGVTLGGTSLTRGKRHPTIEDDVIIGAGAQILGPITVGRSARVGSNAVVVRDVPSGATVVGIPAHEVDDIPKTKIFTFTSYGTPTEGADDHQVMARLRDQIQLLEARVQQLEKNSSFAAGDAATRWEQKKP